MTPIDYDCRYERRGDTFELKMWRDAGAAKLVKGTVAEAPDWLKDIIAVGRAGGHVSPVTQPPPDEIMWFAVDIRFQLLYFESLGGDQCLTT